METLKSLNLAVRLVLEICVLVALGYWGIVTGRGWIGKIGLGIGGPLLTAVLWGVFVAPQSTVHLPGGARLVVELAVFASGAAALFATRQPGLALAFGLVYTVNRVLMVVWRQ